MARCPSCRFEGASVLQDARLKCAQCGGVYELKLAYPPVPRERAVAVGGARQRSALVALIVVCSVLLALGVVVAGFFSRVEESPEPGNSARAGTEPDEPQVKLLQAAVGETVIQGMSAESPWWVFSYRNSGNVGIASPRVTVKLFDGDGRHIRDVDVGAYVLYLAPGDTAWVFFSASAYKHARRADFVAVGPKGANTYTRGYHRLDVQDVQVTPRSLPTLKNYFFVDGKIYNDIGHKARVTVLQGIGYDSEGRACAYCIGTPEEFNLERNGRAAFRLQTGTHNAGTPVRWEVHAWGAVRE